MRNIVDISRCSVSFKVTIRTADFIGCKGFVKVLKKLGKCSTL